MWIGWDVSDKDFQDMLNADYVVAYYTHQVQRGVPARLLDYLAHQEPEHVVWIDGLEYVRLYRMNAGVEADAVYTPANALFGERILLDGHSRSQSTIAAGQTLGVGLSWQVLRAPEERLKVFVHVLDSGGRLVAQHDSEPLAWHSSTSDWRAGEQYTDRHGVYLPAELPAGEYHVLAGLYRLSGERLAITLNGQAAGDALDLGSVTVYAPEQGVD
jgi:hypothetical protein